MHELDGGCRGHMLRAVVAAQLGGCDGQHRAETFAAGIDQVVGQLGDELDFRYGLVENDAIDRLHVLVDNLEQRCEAFRLARLIQGDDYSHGKFLGLLRTFLGV